MFRRNLPLPKPGRESFFLWGPRQTGKTTLLRQAYPGSRWIDLLKTEEYRRYLTRPELLRLEAGAAGSGAGAQVVIDEIQKVPALLDEVHWLIENRGMHFALCGSSARKVRRGGANLLGGRAARFELHGLSAGELGGDLDLVRMLRHGYLPAVYAASQPKRRLAAYVADYLREEVAAEGLVRNLPAFSGFLDAAALSDGSVVNFTNIARDCGVSSPTAKNYFQVLEDTLLGRWLPACRRKPKRRPAVAPKFYFADVGVVNSLVRRGEVEPGSEGFGKAFENWVFHELTCYASYLDDDLDLRHWRLASGVEVDFVLGRGRIELAVEAKGSRRIGDRHLKGLRSLALDHPGVPRRVVACLEPKPWRTDDGIDVLPAEEFAARLWSGGLA